MRRKGLDAGLGTKLGLKLNDKSMSTHLFKAHTFTVTSLLTSPAPSNVGPDEQRPPQASKYTQQDEGGQLHQVPWSVKLHVEQHQSAVSKRVDGA